MTQHFTPITVAYGDGIGPEIMEATLHLLKEAGAAINIQQVEIGEKIYLNGQKTGLSASAWESIRNSKAFLKGPITTPQGGGFKSLNVTIRTTLGLFANVRPSIAYAPFISTKHPGMDLVIIRENEEDLYMGIEYRPTSETFEALKMMTAPGCKRIIRYAFEYAIAHGRKKVTCFSKDNILKLTDGLFHSCFEEIAKEYPSIEKEHWIVDIGAAKLADSPSDFDVIVMPNLYGDILSDVAAQIAGSVGLAGSANIGEHHAMFEAIHGSAPRRAGQNVANPSGLMLAAVQMLVHIGQPSVAALIQNSWLKTIEDGIHTYDIYHEKISKQLVGTKEFTQAVINRLGKQPEKLPTIQYGERKTVQELKKNKVLKKETKEIVGLDVFIESDQTAEQLALSLKEKIEGPFELELIANRGVKVWPVQMPETICSDCWRCRLIKRSSDDSVTEAQAIALLSEIQQLNLNICQVHFLFDYDGKPGFTSLDNS
jgi:isocitrate dehydrogenase